MKIKEVRTIDDVKLRTLCIKANWYTKGTNEEYSNMFLMCEQENIAVDQLYEIAKDIYEHTILSDANAKYIDPSSSETDNILNMMIYLNDCCYVYY